MDKTEFSASNCIPENMLNIICILERDEKHHSYKIIRSRSIFTLIAKFPAENAESMPRNNASVQQAATHQDKKQNSSEDKLRNLKRKRGKKKLFLAYFWSELCKSNRKAMNRNRSNHKGKSRS